MLGVATKFTAGDRVYRREGATVYGDSDGLHLEFRFKNEEDAEAFMVCKMWEQQSMGKEVIV